MEDSHQACRGVWRLRHRSEDWLQSLLALLFPQFWRDEYGPCRDLKAKAALLADELNELLEAAGVDPGPASKAFWAEIPEIHRRLIADAEALERHDPAAESVEEVLLAYPGFLAVAVHRIAHRLYESETPLLPRLLAEWAHRQTGIDIHPGARIASPFVIDHGTGVVIGETTVIGPGVKLYQSVTLGALSVRKDLAETKRHPTLEAGVVVYAGATILGGRTVIGEGSVIGGGAWLTRSVPPRSLVTRSDQILPLKSEEDAHEFLAYGENI
ncbi:MAG: hypothetical protein MH204_02660 [Fimbriimonadaceae bacterium]|nr:hypothetical protein [Fimbriimonadaceae bacterium]